MSVDVSSGRRYRSRLGVPKHARIRWEAADYTLAWGQQRFEVPHVKVSDPNGDYGVDLRTFFRTHAALPDLEDHYVKVVTVRAVCVAVEAVLVTRVNGSTEMTAVVPVGGFVVENPDGEQYAMSAEDFAVRYEPDEP
jgi:hypothetical protein